MVLKVCKENKKSVMQRIREGKLDAIELSTTNFVDEILLTMHTHGILECLYKGLPDKRNHNTTVPFNVILTAAIAAKMKVRTSLTDIPYAISDYRLLAKMGYTVVDQENGLEASLMTEGSIRHLLGKYDSDNLITGYNNIVQNYIMPKMDIVPNIHILDCTDIEVNYFNDNYENSGIAYSKRLMGNEKVHARGYKLGTLRGIVGDSGIIEEICFGALNVHDLVLTENMLKTTNIFKSGDILISDRGFLSRDLINYLKAGKNVDTYIPLRKDMDAYKIAVSIATEENQWRKHPSKRYSTQKICFVPELGDYWEVKNSDYSNVPLNGCVVWDTEYNNYSVFVTTDTAKSAEMIMKTYCLRTEIEEDYRQLKDFWKLEDFKSTKLSVISFHIICVLFGYLFFQLYTMMPEGEKYRKRSLPVILKSYDAKAQSFIIIYSENEFCILTLFELMEVYSALSENTKSKLKFIMG